MALPSWNFPRLYLPAQTFWQRWWGSSLSPPPAEEGNKYLAALPHRFQCYLLRLKAALGLLPTQTANSLATLPIEEFVKEVIPEFSWAVVLVGAMESGQKTILQLWDKQNRVVGYLKYSDREEIRHKIYQEYKILTHVRLGPTPLKYGGIGKREAFVMEPVIGKHPLWQLPPSKEIFDFLQDLVRTELIPLNQHSWIQNFRQHAGEQVQPWLQSLENRDWPVAIGHGDYHPANLLHTKNQGLQAIDWEHSLLEGFPYIDLVYYCLTVAQATYPWSPAEARDYVVRLLTDPDWSGLTTIEAESIVRITAYHYAPSFQQESLQTWWQAVWEQ